MTENDARGLSPEWAEGVDAFLEQDADPELRSAIADGSWPNEFLRRIIVAVDKAWAPRTVEDRRRALRRAFATPMSWPPTSKGTAP